MSMPQQTQCTKPVPRAESLPGVVVDLAPWLERRNCGSTVTAELALAIDLRQARACVDKLLSIATRKFPDRADPQASTLIGWLEDLNVQLDTLDPEDAHRFRLLQQIMQRAKLVGEALILLLRREEVLWLTKRLQGVGSATGFPAAGTVGGR